MNDFFFDNDPLAVLLRHRRQHNGRLASFRTHDGRTPDLGLTFYDEDPRIGGFSAVFRMKRADGGPDLALKIAHRQDACGPRLIRETEGARVQQRLADETGVVPAVGEIGSVDGVPAVVMNWVDGRPLEELLNKIAAEPKPIERLVDLMVAVCDSLEQCEKAVAARGGAYDARHFVHGDLHPRNIIISDRADVRGGGTVTKAWLVDFSESAVGRPRGPLGINLEFASPELKRRFENPIQLVGPPSDQFSVGRMLQRSLAKIESLPKANRLQKVGRRMTHQTPEKRYADWQSCITAMTHAKSHWYRRRSVRWSTSVGVLVLAMLVGYFFRVAGTLAPAGPSGIRMQGRIEYPGGDCESAEYQVTARWVSSSGATSEYATTVTLSADGSHGQFTVNLQLGSEDSVMPGSEIRVTIEKGFTRWWQHLNLWNLDGWRKVADHLETVQGGSVGAAFRRAIPALSGAEDPDGGTWNFSSS